ncbi:MAG: hypothetical protein ACT443_14785, partial [Gemmatimonadota bacterium]
LQAPYWSLPAVSAIHPELIMAKRPQTMKRAAQKRKASQRAKAAQKAKKREKKAGSKKAR